MPPAMQEKTAVFLGHIGLSR